MNVSHQSLDTVIGTFIGARNLTDAFEAALIAKRKLGCNPVICLGKTADGKHRLAVYVADLIVVDDPVN